MDGEGVVGAGEIDEGGTGDLVVRTGEAALG